MADTKKNRTRRKSATTLIRKVAENIRHCRMKMNLSQEQLQESSGLRIYKYESGKYDMTLTTLNILNEHLKVEPYQLLK